MNAFDALTMRCIAIVGRTGSGKSSLFFGSRYVRDVLITDTGSLGHIPHHRGDGACDVLQPDGRGPSPIEAAREWITDREKAGRCWCLDSWSALEWQQCVWYKAKFNKSVMSKPDHNTVVNQLRDFAMFLALGHGFVLFNTGNGGYTMIEGMEPIPQPKGCLTGYPSLNGCTPGKETILARWSTVWVLTPGKPDKSREEQSNVPRGFILPDDDFRGADFGHYVPLKDGYGVLRAGTRLVPGRDVALQLRVDPVLAGPPAMIDVLLDRIMGNAEPPAASSKRTRKAKDVEPSTNGEAREVAPSGIE